MKIKRLIALLLATIFTLTPLTGCIPEGENVSVLALSASSTTLVVNGGSSVTLTAEIQSSSDEVKSRTITYSVLEGNATIAGNEVRSSSTSSVGDVIKVQASAGDLTSNVLQLTVVADQSTVLLELEITAPSANIVPSGQVVLTAKKIPSTAVANVEWIITSGEALVQSYTNGTIVAKSDATIGGTIKVKAKSGSIESAEYTLTVIDPTLRVEFAGVKESDVVDGGASSLKTLNVVVIDIGSNSIESVAQLYADVPNDYSHLLDASVSGREVTLTALGDGDAELVLSVEGAVETFTMDVKCIMPPESLDLPEYIKMANGSYAIGVNNIDITAVDTSMEENLGRRTKVGTWMDSFTDLYSYTISAGAKLAVPIAVGGTNVCQSYEYVIPADRGVTEEDGVLTFNGEGDVTITVRSTSGSVRETSISFTVKMVTNGISVSTFEELRAVGMYGENLDNNGLVRPITFNPTENIAGIGYALVPAYLKNASEVYNNASDTFSKDHFRGMSNTNLKFYGSTTIIGNNVTIDISRLPILRGNEVFTSTSGATYNLFGDSNVYELNRFYKGTFLQITPSSHYWADDTANKVYKVNKDKVGVLDISKADATEHNAMENFIVKATDFAINGNWGVDPTSAPISAPSANSAMAVYNRTVEINRASLWVDAFSTTVQVVYPECYTTIDNVEIRNASTGMRTHRMSNGSTISNMTFDNLFAGGLQVSASLVTLKDLAFGAIGGTGLELVPEQSDLAGNQSAYIASGGADRTGLVNQNVTIAGDFELLEGNLNNLNTHTLNAFFSLLGAHMGNPTLTPTQAMSSAFLSYVQKYAGADSNKQALIGALGTQMAGLLQTQVLHLNANGTIKGANLIALYFKDTSNVSAENPLPTDNLTTVNYQLDSTGGSTNEIIPLASLVNGLFDPILLASGVIGDALPYIVEGMNTTNKYISMDLSFLIGTDYLSIGELIMYNPFYGKTASEVQATLSALLPA